MIEVTNLTKKYGDHIAVDNLSFRVEKGQIYGFLGPNGAGKSTTMNIITGYLAATGGTVTINGKDIQKDPEEAKACVGYLPELPPLYMDMTVQEYLKFVAQLKKVPREERVRQVAEVMEMTQIDDKKDRLIKNLSKGYRQRVGLAQAILGYPEVIILDEPTVGLDPKQIIEIRDLIRRLGENHTIILSSHILSEVSAVCDHIMIISHGKLVASDSPEGLQTLMSGASELEIEVKGSFESVRSAVDAVPGIRTVEEMPSGEEGCARVHIVSGEGADIREAVFYALAENRLPILEMQHRKKSLEDIFLELTEDTGSSETAGGEIEGGEDADGTAAAAAAESAPDETENSAAEEEN
ncbi:MAG: ABC transporter ATP-binding protein [Candidatus Gastranaerophilales bacterium]|nr:ABC transporter ATP-binding protein [Candidatus Gastranaerophilales bacterium]